MCVVEKFYARVDPSRGDPVRNFLNFFTQTIACAYRVCVPISVSNGQKTWPPNANMHTHTHTHTDRQFELYILDKLQHPASPGGQHMPAASPLHFIVPQLIHTFVIEPIQHGSGEETGRLYR